MKYFKEISTVHHKALLKQIKEHLNKWTGERNGNSFLIFLAGKTPWSLACCSPWDCREFDMT